MIRKHRHNSVLLLALLISTGAQFMATPRLSRTFAQEGQAIQFVEKYVLSEDREQVLRDLVPGTEDYYFFHCLHYQQLGQFDRVDALLGEWEKRRGATERFREIRHRQALLQYASQPQETLDYLQREFRLRFDHQRQVAGAQSGLPTSLDESAITWSRFLSRNLDSNATDRVQVSGFRELAKQDLNAQQLRHFLGRVSDPTIPGLVDLIERDLREKDSGGFGTVAAHNVLTEAQLKELAGRIGTLENETNFVNQRLVRLRPSADVDWQNNNDEGIAYLERLWEYVSGLNDSHNSLKACVLYQLLVLERATGQYDRERFLTYLSLPRQVSYINPRMLRDTRSNRVANLGVDFQAQTRIPPVRDDEDLVRDYLLHFLRDADDWSAYSEWVETNYLKRLFAEAKITAGLGDSRQWSEMLSPTEYRELIDRVDLEFAPDNQSRHAVEDVVEVKLFTKNINNLIVKVFEINAGNFYRQYQRPVNTDISLDGLVPNWEETYQYDEAPALRVMRTFRFEQLDHRGVYIIDFIGNGTSSRVLIRKGGLQHLSEITAAGQEFRVFDDGNQPVNDATLFVDGNYYRADNDGTILVPFSTQPGRRRAILEHDGFSSLVQFDHVAEQYGLMAGLYVDREALISDRETAVLVRPQLLVAGTPIPAKLLKDVRLRVTTTNLEGIDATSTFDELELSDSGELSVPIQVPPRLASLSITLEGEIESIVSGEKQALSATQSWQLNGIDRTTSLADLHLGKSTDGYWLEVRGKTGEPLKDRPVLVKLQHRDFAETIDVRLQSNDAGRIALGTLPDMARVTAEMSGSPASQWYLPLTDQTRPSVLHGTEDSEIRLVVNEADSDAAAWSLIEERGGVNYADHSDQLRLEQGLLIAGPLKRGDYYLLDRRRGERIQVRVTEAEVQSGFAMGPVRHLELRDTDPLHVRELRRGNDSVTLRLGGDFATARVHVFASRYQPEYDLFDQLAIKSGLEPLAIRRGARNNAWQSGRTIGEEYQYILDRQYQEKYPGNMLTRPSLLLNPWALRSTDNEMQVAEDGAEFDASEAPSEDARARGRRQRKGDAGSSSHFASLDFLMNGSGLLLHQRPNENGEVTIDLSKLGDKQFLRIAIVNDDATILRTVSLAIPEAEIRDLRLADERALDPGGHFTRQKQYRVLDAQKRFELTDVGNSQYQQFDSLGDVYRYYLSATGDATLAEFEFVMRWPTLSDEERFDLYTKYACHELNVFIANKDPEYFRSVVMPYLESKYHTTFVDEYLTDAGLESWLEVWRFERLNVFEKALLGRRVDGRGDAIRQFVGDDYDNHPTSRRDFDRLFDIAMASGYATWGDDGEVSGRFRDVRRGLTADKGIDFEVGSQMAPEPNDAPQLGAGGRGGGGGAGLDDAVAAAPGAPRPNPSRAEAGGEVYFAQADEARSKMSNQDRPITLQTFGAEAPQFGGFGADDFQNQYLDMKVTELEEKREQIQSLYRRLPPTQEWVENNYWHLPIESQTAELIGVNRFWRDFALHPADQPFLSPYFPEASGNFAEMMMALAVLDLPFDRPEHELEFADGNMYLTPAGELIAYYEQVRPAALDNGASTVLVSENFFRFDDRHVMIDGRQHEKFLRSGFLPGVLYGAQVVVTNPTSMPQDVDLLLQIPAGAMPANGAQTTRSMQLELAPFSTETTEYHFYFPMVGQYGHYPAHVSREDQSLAFADGFEFSVVAEPEDIDKSAWAWLSQNGTDDQVLDYLRQENLQRIDLGQIAFRMQDEAFFDAAMAILDRRFAYDATLWSYGIHHNRVDVIRQFLEHSDGFVRQLGGAFDSELVSVRPVMRHWFQHREYWPLVNARTHQLGSERRILNASIWQQYHHLLNILARQDAWSADGRLAMVYYLTLQDRVTEALREFAKIDAEAVNERLQYDYLAAWLAMYESEPDRAAAIADRYADYPVKRWRNLFAALSAQIDEIQGKAPSLVDVENQSQRQGMAAASTPAFEFTVAKDQVDLQYQNIDAITVNYYLMDVELLFSQNPFVQKQDEGFAMIRPNSSQSMELAADKDSHSFAIPEEYRSRNVLVEIVAAGQSQSRASYSNSMNVRAVEQFGQLLVSEASSKKPLSKVYVKVYARTRSGDVAFYKDGYTDLRGQFDYVSLSNQSVGDVDRFSVLIIDPDYGAVVREMAPPLE